MADQKTSELASAGVLAGSEELAIVQGGSSVKTTLTDVAGLATAQQTVQNWAVPYRGALVKRTSDLTGITWPLLVPWQAAEYDTDSFWSIGQPSRLTIPVGVTKVRLLGGCALETGALVGGSYLSIAKNGSTTEPGLFCGVSALRNDTGGYDNNDAFTVTPVLEVSAGDYFELRINTTLSGIDQVLADPQTFLGIEVIETSDAEARPYDYPISYAGMPGSSQAFDFFVVTRDTKIPLDGGQSQFYALTAPSGDTVIDVQKNGVSIGSITFLNGSNTGTYSGAETDFVAGDRLTHVAPATLNGLSDLALNYRMVLS